MKNLKILVVDDSTNRIFCEKNAVRDRYLKKIMSHQKMKSIIYDLLTGLINYPTFNEILKYFILHTISFQHSLALIYLDIDNFMITNDTLGHLVGDEILIEVSHRLKVILSADIIISRTGEDEFAILLSGPDVEQSALQLAASILSELNKPYCLATDKARVTLSGGIAYLDNKQMTSYQLISHAKFALNHAKKSGGNRIVIFK